MYIFYSIILYYLYKNKLVLFCILQKREKEKKKNH